MKNYQMTGWLRAVVIPLVLALNAIPTFAQEDDLQAYINKLSKARSVKAKAPADITVIDLSQFTATNRTTTLDVANGRNFRFINGTLTRANSLDGPILHVGGGSYVEIGDKAFIDARNSSSSRETILMDSGELWVGDFGGVYSSNASNTTKAVLMTSDKDVLTKTAHSTDFKGVLLCQAANATITIEGGTFHTGSAERATIESAADIHITDLLFEDADITLTTHEAAIVQKAAPNKKINITAPNKYPGDVVMRMDGRDAADFVDYVAWKGKSDYFLYNDLVDNTIKLYYDDLQSFIDDFWPKPQARPYPVPCGCSWIDPYVIKIPCREVKVKKEVVFPEDDLYWAINGKPEPEETEEIVYDCEGSIDQGENDVIIRPGAKVRVRYIHWRGCGCGKYIYVYGTLYIDRRIWFTNYWRFIHVMPGGKVVLTDPYGECEETVIYMEGGEAEYEGGECTGGKYGWYCTGGIIYIRGGWLGGGTAGGWTGTKGISYHYDGTVHGGIRNYGVHYWYGGTCSGGGLYTIYNYKGGKFYYYGGKCTGPGAIWNEGDLYIDGGGDVDCQDIYLIRGCHIYILKRLTFVLRLHITVDNIILDTPLILGGDGYTLTEDECSKLEIDLPDGYGWRYDPDSHGIVIYSLTSVSSVNAEKSVVVNTHNIAGQELGGARKGVNIETSGDGSVRKVIRK